MKKKKSDSEILKAVIEKAEKNDPLLCEKTGIMYCNASKCNSPHYLPPCMCNDCACLRPHLNIIIFNHEFAKAFWGYDWKEGDCFISGIDDLFEPMPPKWQYHLQALVLKKDKLAYLQKFL